MPRRKSEAKVGCRLTASRSAASVTCASPSVCAASASASYNAGPFTPADTLDDYIARGLEFMLRAKHHCCQILIGANVDRIVSHRHFKEFARVFQIPRARV